MAIRYGYFDSEVTGVDENGMPVFDRAETSDLFRLLFANLVSSGVLATPADCFKVNADTGLTLRVRPGFAMINGAFAYDAEESAVTLAAANANLPRLDRVVLRCNYLNRLCEIIIKTGTPASTPAAPELLQPASGDYYELCLATIRVEAGATSVTQSAITDTRGDSSVCGFITQLIDHLDTSEFMDQLTAWQEEYSAEQQSAFTDWFNQIKDQLSEDAAGNLQNQINAINSSIDDIEQSVENLPANLIDDTASDDAGKTWSSKKLKNVEDAVPKMKLVTFQWTAIGINANLAPTYIYDIAQSGYKPVAIAGAELLNNDIGGKNSGWCVMTRAWIGQGTVKDQVTDTMTFTVWNQHQSQQAVVKALFKVLYVTENAF